MPAPTPNEIFQNSKYPENAGRWSFLGREQSGPDYERYGIDAQHQQGRLRQQEIAQRIAEYAKSYNKRVSEPITDDTDLDSLLQYLLTHAPQVEQLGRAPSGPGGGMSALGGAGAGAATGALAGSALGPWGAAAGAVIGGVGGAFAGGGGDKNAAKSQYENALNQQVNAAEMSHEQMIDYVKRAIMQRKLRERVNQQFNSPQMEALYNQIQGTISQNNLAGVTQQFSDLLKKQSFGTASQGLTGSSIHAERLGDLQQGQNTAAIQGQAQAQAYTNSLRDQNEQKRQQLVSTVSQQNPGTQAGFNQQIDSITNQTRQLGQQYANQAAFAQAGQQNQALQSQSIGGGLSGIGGVYQGYNQGYNQQTQLNNQQMITNDLYRYLSGGN